MFGRRLAYTGTPNNLVPRAMGECQYEALSDGRMVETLASAEVVTVERVRGEWEARSLLRLVARHEPPLCALIDPGALIVGLTNLQVGPFPAPYTCYEGGNAL